MLGAATKLGPGQGNKLGEGGRKGKENNAPISGRQLVALVHRCCMLGRLHSCVGPPAKMQASAAKYYYKLIKCNHHRMPPY